MTGYFSDDSYRPITPSRQVDTRNGQCGGTLHSGDQLVMGLGQAGGGSAVALNVTATNTTADGFFTLYPAGAGRPTSSNLNFTTGRLREFNGGINRYPTERIFFDVAVFRPHDVEGHVLDEFPNREPALRTAWAVSDALIYLGIKHTLEDEDCHDLRQELDDQLRRAERELGY